MRSWNVNVGSFGACAMAGHATILALLIAGSDLHWLFCLLVALSAALSWAFIRELTRLYRNEQTALAAARTALAQRDELMGIIAHDLRSPLATILMGAFAVRDADHKSVGKHAAAIVSAAHRMAHLITGMLDAATLEAGRLSVVAAPCQASDLLQTSVEAFGGLASNQCIQLHARSVPNCQVRADKERVLQVLSNLLGNALKFTAPGGAVTLSVRQMHNEVRFTVSDTGPGISAEQLPHIFERFWKWAHPGKKSTGLGLYIAKGIVDAHGGRIWADSVEGKGTSFHFTLPSEPTPPEQQACPEHTLAVQP